MDSITQLYPAPVHDLPLTGAYLAHDLRQYRRSSGRPDICTNFIASIDGRIAVPRKDGSGMTVPASIANERDWRLFQELAAQADLVISSGRYLRDWAEGRAQEILRVDDPKFADLRQWRLDHGLSPQPDIAIISGSLNFPIPEILTAQGRNVVVFTSADADPQRIRKMENSHAKVVLAGENQVRGDNLARHMGDLGYQTVFNATGPKVLHLLLAGNVLDRLYMTQANKLLGGQPFSSIVEGPLLQPDISLRLNKIYLDPYALQGLGQLFVSYDAHNQAA